MDDKEYGPEISVDGMPDWLDGDERVMGKWDHGGWYYDGASAPADCYASPDRIVGIRLRADHPYYQGRAEPTEDDGDYVRVKQMTAREYQTNDTGSLGWAKRVGLIREETLLEQFERDNLEYPLITDEEKSAVKRAIEWMESRNA